MTDPVVSLVEGEFTPKGGRTGSYWIDTSEMGAADCDMCSGPHYVFDCPACGLPHDTFQGDDEVGCDCGATLRISDVVADEFSRTYGG